MTFPIDDHVAAMPATELPAAFAQATENVKALPTRPDNMTLLRLYGLYKQGSAGDATGERPGMTDFIARAKFDAWSAMAGVDSELAQRQYISLVRSLCEAA